MSERTPGLDRHGPVDLPPATPVAHRGPGSRATTVVFGLLVVALGAIAALVGAGVVLDPVLALVAVLVMLAVGLLLSAIRPQRR